MPTLEQMVRRQRVLADFGEFAMRGDNLDEVLNEGCRLVGEVLGAGRGQILAIENGGRLLLLEAGVAWHPGLVGTMRPDHLRALV